MNETQRDLIRTLADPVRYALWSTLSEQGPATGSELLRRVPEAEGALTRHLNELKRVKAIVPVGDETTRVRTTTWVSTDHPLDWEPGEDATDVMIVSAFERTTAARQERLRELFRQQKNDGLWPEWVDAVFTQEWWVTATAEQFKWIDERLVEVMQEIKQRLAEDGEPGEAAEQCKIWIYGQPRKTFSEQ